MRLPGAPVTNHHDVFLSYSHADLDVATNLRGQLDRCGLTVFRDQERLREGDLWLQALQEAIDACGSFVVLVGRDGVRRWVGAESQVALNRYFGPQDDAERLPIFPILLGGTDPPASRIPEAVSGDIVERGRSAAREPARPDPGSHPGREQGDLRWLSVRRPRCVPPRSGQPVLRPPEGNARCAGLLRHEVRRSPVRWLEISGNSGSGKSSLVNAGLLPLIDQGWLWPRTGFEHWRRIGPMMPGERPVAMLAEHLARTFGGEMSEVRGLLDGDERALSEWLRGRKTDDQTAFLLAIDQFEELFTFADPGERGRFDRLLATALEDAACPLFVISTVRSDFLDRFDELLPRLVPVRNRSGKLWTLPLIGENALREIISGPARLAGIDTSEVQESMVIEARDEPGALPLVQNALQWLWERRTDGRLSGRLFTEHGGLAGILSEGADGLLASLGKQRAQALELLFRLVNVDPTGRRHTRHRLQLAEAVAVAGGGAQGRALIDRLAGTRARDDPRINPPIRLVTVTEETEGQTDRDRDGWVSLIHETLIRSKGADPAGKPIPFWPTLWDYIEQHKDRAARREHLQLQARDWQNRHGFARIFGLAGWSDLLKFRRLAAPGSAEARYLRWSRRSALVQGLLLAAVLAPIVEGLYWAGSRDLPIEVLLERWTYLCCGSRRVPDLVEIPPGSFVMGGGEGQPGHKISFAEPFRIAATEVTFDQWDACVADGGCQGLRADDQGWQRGASRDQCLLG